MRRACSASLDPFSNGELIKKIEDLTLKFQISEENTHANDLDSEDFQEISLLSVKFMEVLQKKDKELRDSNNGPIGRYRRWLKAHVQGLD